MKREQVPCEAEDGGCGNSLCGPKCPCCGETGWDIIHFKAPSDTVDCMNCSWSGVEDKLMWVHFVRVVPPVRELNVYVLQQLWMDAEAQARKTRTIWRTLADDDIGGFTLR